MIRLIVAFALVVLLAVAAVWLVENPGAVELRWGDWLLQTSVPVLVVGLVLLVGVALALYRLIGWILAGPTKIRELWTGNRDEKGYRALTEGMAAIASGDWRLANKSAERADRLLDAPPMSRLLKAQAAQLSGDEAAAEKHFQTMLGTPETELVALRGLLIQAGQRGDHDKALELARRAQKLRPDAGWVQRALFDLQTSGQHWHDALQTLMAAHKNGIYDKETVSAYRATLETAMALDEERAGRPRPAISHAEMALKQDADHIPAIITEARMQQSAGRDRRAGKHLAAAWLRLRHPDIAQAVLDLNSDETPEQRLKRFEDVVKSDLDHAETQLVLGRLALKAGKADLAREFGLAAIDRAEIVDQRFCRLMSDACEQLGENTEEARDWLSRVADAPAPPRWQCTNCHNVSAAWAPLCPSCNEFDGLEWRQAELLAEPVLLAADDPVATEMNSEATSSTH